MELSKENIIAVSDLRPDYLLGVTDVAILQEMARRLLAAEEQQPVAWMVTDIDTGERIIRSDRSYIEGPSQPLYAAPQLPQQGKAVQVPDEADPRDAFENVFPIPAHVSRCGKGYAVHEFNAWSAHDYVKTWDGWNACRAAMLTSEPVSGGDEFPSTCGCHTCRPVTMTDMRFVVCPDCGNKRCPKANDHRNTCSGSNEPGQEGSAYPVVPKPEVK